MIFVLMGTGRPYTETLGMAVFTAGFGSSGASTQGFAAAVSMIQFVIVGVVSVAVLAVLRRREAKL